VDIGSASWWEGECHGVVGHFPRSYVEPRVPTLARPEMIPGAIEALNRNGAAIPNRRSSSASTRKPSLPPPTSSNPMQHSGAIEGVKDLAILEHSERHAPGIADGFLVDHLQERRDSENHAIIQTASEFANLGQ
jgi:hypothetical protein